ncbi:MULTISPECIES: hypothetical protein [unclassified Brevundimonas]|uniref:hypothetical protein n=1 Tax=unclassified Brevundimonas TaxID=2622653 RepID=UPI0025B8D638|nr:MULTISPECIES: hypothetical protein [unclassified Brevundimonas]
MSIMDSASPKPRQYHRLNWPNLVLQPIWQGLVLIFGFGLYLVWAKEPSVALLGFFCAMLLLHNPKYALTARHTPNPPQSGNRNPLQLATSGTLNDINREPLPLLPEFSTIPPRFQALIRILGRPLPYPRLGAILRITDRFLVVLVFVLILPLQVWLVFSQSAAVITYSFIAGFILTTIVLIRRQYRRLYDAYRIGEEPSAPESLPRLS